MSARTKIPAIACTLAVFSAGILSLASGCSRPLLAPTDERSPYDRYDAVRAQYAPQYIEDEYGRRQPNLRGRLGPKN